MAHALAARASSLSAACGLLAVMATLALTATLRIAPAPLDVPTPAIVMATPEPPAPPPPNSHDAPPLEHPDFAPIPIIPTLADPPAANGESFFAPPQPPLITNPSWARMPRDLERFYPRGALRQNVEGRVVLDCFVSALGALACTIASETPAGWGFGAAALNIAAQYTMVPAASNGVPVVGRYRMVVPFEVR